MGAILSPYNTAGQTVVVGPSGDTTGTQDAARLVAAAAALPVSGGVIKMAATGIWYIKCGQVVINQSNVYIDAAGCYISATGSGDVFRMYDSSQAPTTRTYVGGGIIGRPVIDGTNAGNSSCAIHIGDLTGMKVEAWIKNFTGTGSVGLNMENAFFWTEKADVLVKTRNCTRAAQWTTSGAGTTSFGYGSFDISASPATNQQDGIAVLGGAWIYHGRLRLRGDFTSGASATTAAALRIQGQNSGATSSKVEGCHVDVQVECAPNGANAPTTIIMDTSPFCELFGCWGTLDFGYGGGNFAASSVNGTQFSFNGLFNADSNLKPAYSTYGLWGAFGSPVFYAGLPSTVAGDANGSVATMASDFTTMTLSGNVTISLTPANFLSAAIATPQRQTIIIKQSAGGSNTVTWPHNVSPTTSSPTVNWAGGAAPVMTAAANATDVYDLVTYDGATWYGRALQNVS